ncbi:MAG: zinc-dependent metalloprotease [Bacteroidetes bacterium]|nr:zinc-dependent metalloprotease [Bacteroidota bacterium]
MKKVLCLTIFILLFHKGVFSQTTYIKTVVHVLYTSGLDISDASVLNYIKDVNDGFAKQLTPTFTRVTPIFDTLWSNTNIQLCLANFDPNGLPTNGITHTLISDPEYPGFTPSVAPWDGTHYFNIYLAPVYNEPGYPSFVLGGWASTPTNPVSGSTCSFAIASTNSIPYISELLTHEIGHVFGLDHLSDDAISDTPKGIEPVSPSTGYSTSCSSTLQSANTSNLSQDGMHWGGIDPPDMVENFMGLSFCCSYMFTNGQKSLMQAYIQTYLSGWISSSCFTTNINDFTLGSAALELYPNPAIDKIYISNAKTEQKQRYLITNNLGENVLSGEINNNNTAINIVSLAKGIYMIRFSNNTNNPLKFIKQ